MQNQKVVSKQSEKLIEQKFGNKTRKEKVEERLIRDASLRR